MIKIKPLILITNIILLTIMSYSLIIKDENIAAAGTTDTIYGVIRATSTGTWVLLSNSTHVPYNIASVTQTDDYVQVNFSKTFTKIHYSAITPDDGFVVTDRNVGASVGLDTAYVYISQGGVKVNPNTVTSTGTNFWFFVEGE